MSSLLLMLLDFFFLQIKSCRVLSRKRDNKTLKDLAKVNEAWCVNELAKKDKIQQLRMQLNDAIADINQTNHALDELRQIKTIQYNTIQGYEIHKEANITSLL